MEFLLQFLLMSGVSDMEIDKPQMDSSYHMFIDAGSPIAVGMSLHDCFEGLEQFLCSFDSLPVFFKIQD